MENLINNALESQTAFAEPPPVEIRLSVSRNQVEIEVLDRGEGVPEGAGQKIFDPFYTNKTRGSGVGLSISKRFVEAVGGVLKVQGRRGGGTRAVVSLPRSSPKQVNTPQDDPKQFVPAQRQS